jgi:tetratricopeptide (TPR) repeat protein
MAAHKTKSSPREQVRDAVHIPIRVAEIMRHAGRAYWDSNEYEPAEQIWLRAAELSPEEMEARQLLSNLYDRQGRLDESLKWVRNLEQLDPEDTRHIRNEGRLLSRLKRYDEAEKLFRELIRRDPNSSFNYAALAELLLLRGGDKAEAASLAMRAVDMDPSGPNMFLLATVAQQSGDVATAKKAITLALAREPDNPQYRQLASLITNRP